jgi:hypothetical protein
MKKNESSVTYEVCATFGSEFQRDAAERSLHKVLRAWAEFHAKKHQKNKISVEKKRIDANPKHKGPQGVC